MLLQLLSSMLEESDDVPQRLLDTILGAIVPPKREENPGAATFAGELIRANEATLASHVQKLLASMIAGNAADTELECSYRTLLLEVTFWRPLSQHHKCNCYYLGVSS